MRLKIGDSVKVKPGVRDPDFNNDLSDYQGRVVEDSDGLFCIQWDSHTLKKLPHAHIKEAEQKGFGWESIYLEESDLELTTPRDTEAEVAQVFDQLEDQFFWAHLGPEGDRISAVLSGISLKDKSAILNAWKNHLKAKLSFPFQAEVAEWQETGPLTCDEVVTVHRILESEEVDPDHGLFVEVKNSKNHCLFPLSDLEVVDKQSKNFTPVQDYVIWFANR